MHRRLAARNILLTFMNEVKIAGFGPQPENEEIGDDAEAGKKVKHILEFSCYLNQLNVGFVTYVVFYRQTEQFVNNHSDYYMYTFQ